MSKTMFAIVEVTDVEYSDEFAKQSKPIAVALTYEEATAFVALKEKEIHEFNDMVEARERELTEWVIANPCPYPEGLLDEPAWANEPGKRQVITPEMREERVRIREHNFQLHMAFRPMVAAWDTKRFEKHKSLDLNFLQKRSIGVETIHDIGWSITEVPQV